MNRSATGLLGAAHRESRLSRCGKELNLLMALRLPNCITDFDLLAPGPGNPPHLTGAPLVTLLTLSQMRLGGSPLRYSTGWNSLFVVVSQQSAHRVAWVTSQSSSGSRPELLRLRPRASSEGASARSASGALRTTSASVTIRPTCTQTMD